MSRADPSQLVTAAASPASDYAYKAIFQRWPLLARYLAATTAAVIVVVVIVGQLTGKEINGGFLGLTVGIAVPFIVLGVLVLMRAAQATRLNRELQLSRERLVVAREEERRRLRRDLHDGLGPALAGMSMQVRAALRHLPQDNRGAEILTALATDLRSCTMEVRQLVDELRPPMLDRGLETALRSECRRFTMGELSVTCEVNGNLDSLPAAVEVAAFRIVAEALTNVARHSRAKNCHVTIHRNGVLRVEIIDDGIGITSSTHAGLGLSSMRERAAELGGDCTIRPIPRGGTSVRLEVPIRPIR